MSCCQKKECTAACAKHVPVNTACIHAGQAPDPHTGAIIMPISMSTTFAQASPGQFKKYEYSRSANPTRDAFEECVAACEGGKHGMAFASGSAAIGCVVGTLKQGDHVLSMNCVYGGTHRYFSQVCPTMGIDFTFADFTDVKALTSSIKPNTKLIWLETPTNPTLTVVDIEYVASLAKKQGCLLAVDNTFSSPHFQQPLRHGADISCSSVTKYIGGHSDTVMGVLACKDDELAKKLRFYQNAAGAVPSPFDSFLALRGMKTLAVRMDRHQENAMKVATFLEGHAKVDKVVYPGLKSHPQHEVAKKQMTGFSGMICLYLKGGINESRRFLETLRVFQLAESLGAVESLVEHPAIMTHSGIPIEERLAAGISDSLCRLSVGIESVEDLIKDLENALAAI
eukprot:TRINITY_DN3083_c0_g1_i1.p1 TRINITY_DN3083_c0_g1~~TRINITY_DN3083_c0_g1_i1.p1  ORF type:complete len:397 (+),score=156.69 TRINITY_DN3083_c0_g1_i1:2-1192(+)